MNRILHRTYDGLIPRLEPSGLPENAAQIAENVDLRRGVLTPVLVRAVDTRDGAADLAEGTQTIYLWRYTDYLLVCGHAGDTSAASWAALAATGGFKVTIDGTVYACTPDFTGATTMQEVANAIRDAIQAATEGNELVLWDTTAHRFTVQAARAVTVLAAPVSGVNLASASWMNAGTPTVTQADGEKWLTWTGDVNVVVGPINDDQYSRVYYTGDGIPKMRLRIGGEDVTRDIKIEPPATYPTAGNEYPYDTAPATDARAAFDITEARMTIRAVGATSASPTYRIYPMAFTQVGDAIIVASGVGTTPTSFTWAIEFKVNGVWESALDADSDSMHLNVTDPNGLYRLQFAFGTGGNWYVRWGGGHISWGGGIRLTFSAGEEAEDLDGSTFVTYCCSFVTDIGEEGPLSEASPVYLAEADTDIEITAIPQPVSTTRGIVLVRLYRAAGGVFRWLADIPLGTLAYTDSTPGVDDDLGEEADDQTTNPPDDLEGIIACTGGWYAAFRGREFLASQANLPTSWPVSYRLTLQHPIVALASAGNDVFVMTEGRPAVMSGSDPAELIQANIECDQACVSAAGVVVLGQTVLYPSPDGLVAMYAGAAKVVTAEWFRREDWQALVPTGIRAASHDGRYYAALTGLDAPYMLIVDFSESVDRLTTADAVVDGLYADLLDDALYAIEDGDIMGWQGGTDPERIDWQGRDWVFPQPVSFAALRVVATSYATGTPEPRPVVTLYAAGTQVWQGTIAAAVAKKLPRLRPERRWSLRIQSRVEVTEANLATGIGALASG